MSDLELPTLAVHLVKHHIYAVCPINFFLDSRFSLSLLLLVCYDGI